MLFPSSIQHTMLNNQGGPRSNAHAKILDTNQQVIPHLYGAGELGHVNAINTMVVVILLIV